jgi:hypothetical protein
VATPESGHDVLAWIEPFQVDTGSDETVAREEGGYSDLRKTHSEWTASFFQTRSCTNRPPDAVREASPWQKLALPLLLLSVIARAKKGSKSQRLKRL